MTEPFDACVERAIDAVSASGTNSTHYGRVATVIHQAQTCGLPQIETTFDQHVDHAIAFFFGRLQKAVQTVVARQMPELDDLGIEDLQFAIRSLFENQDLGVLIQEVFGVIGRSGSPIERVPTTVDEAINDAWSSLPESEISKMGDAIIDGRTEEIEETDNAILMATDVMTKALYLGFQYELIRLVRSGDCNPITTEEVVEAANAFRDQKIDSFLLQVIDIAEEL